MIAYDLTGVSAPHGLAEDRSSGPPEPMPTLGRIERWRQNLRTDREARDWLRARGLSRRTIEGALLGCHRGSRRLVITIPLLSGRSIVNIKRRFLDGQEPKYMALRGQRHVLYPDVPAKGVVVLCEGEFDALIARQHGIRAVTGTTGVLGWDPAWSARLAGRRVAVVFDAGDACADIAWDRAKVLKRAGAREAWAVELGLEPGEDLTDWFVKYGRSAADLRALLAEHRHVRYRVT